MVHDSIIDVIVSVANQSVSGVVEFDLNTEIHLTKEQLHVTKLKLIQNKHLVDSRKQLNYQRYKWDYMGQSELSV